MDPEIYMLKPWAAEDQGAIDLPPWSVIALDGFYGMLGEALGSRGSRSYRPSSLKCHSSGWILRDARWNSGQHRTKEPGAEHHRPSHQARNALYLWATVRDCGESVLLGGVDKYSLNIIQNTQSGGTRNMLTYFREEHIRRNIIHV